MTVDTTGQTNATCAQPFNEDYPGLLGKILLIQPSEECFVLTADWPGEELPVSEGIKLAADERVIISMDDIDSSVLLAHDEAFAWLAGVTASGTSDIKVWELV